MFLLNIFRINLFCQKMLIRTVKLQILQYVQNVANAKYVVIILKILTFFQGREEDGSTKVQRSKRQKKVRLLFLF